jgi:hypothetical protein
VGYSGSPSSFGWPAPARLWEAADREPYAGCVGSSTADPVTIADVGQQIESEIEAALLTSRSPSSIDSKVTKY